MYLTYWVLHAQPQPNSTKGGAWWSGDIEIYYFRLTWPIASVAPDPANDWAPPDHRSSLLVGLQRMIRPGCPNPLAAIAIDMLAWIVCHDKVSAVAISVLS